jgi:hypothetical protein
MPVVEVGMGVGYDRRALLAAVACLFAGLGRPGEDDNGSNAGSRLGAGRLTPDVAGSEGARPCFVGLDSIMMVISRSAA